MNNAWILVKPETLNYHINALEKVLYDNGFIIEKKKSSSKFLEMSDELYKKASSLSPMHKAMNIYLFGDKANYCEVWYLSKNENIDTLSLFAKLGSIKRDFRKKHHVEGLKINVEYYNNKNAFGFGYFHVPDPDNESIERESIIVNKYCD